MYLICSQAIQSKWAPLSAPVLSLVSDRPVNKKLWTKYGIQYDASCSRWSMVSLYPRLWVILSWFRFMWSICWWMRLCSMRDLRISSRALWAFLWETRGRVRHDSLESSCQRAPDRREMIDERIISLSTLWVSMIGRLIIARYVECALVEVIAQIDVDRPWLPFVNYKLIYFKCNKYIMFRYISGILDDSSDFWRDGFLESSILSRKVNYFQKSMFSQKLARGKNLSTFLNGFGIFSYVLLSYISSIFFSHNLMIRGS